MSTKNTISTFDSLKSKNPAMNEVLQNAKALAGTDVNIILTGETGTGKSSLAEAIHYASARQFAPFLTINCLAIPDNLLESELFGHRKGAFTDAHSDKQGSFELALGGTIFLDEIGDMSISSQGKLLHAIEQKKIRRVGATEHTSFDARFISATNKDLKKGIEDGKFREDLFYRLGEYSLQLPPLRERPEDIPVYLEYFIQDYGVHYKKPNLKISKTALSYLSQYDWPGNIRELKNVVRSAVILCPHDMLWMEHFPFDIRLNSQEVDVESAEDFSLDAIMKRHLNKVMITHHWNKTKAAATLKISRPRLDRYLEKYKITQHLPPPSCSLS